MTVSTINKSCEEFIEYQHAYVQKLPYPQRVVKWENQSQVMELQKREEIKWYTVTPQDKPKAEIVDKHVAPKPVSNNIIKME